MVISDTVVIETVGADYSEMVSRRIYSMMLYPGLTLEETVSFQTFRNYFDFTAKMEDELDEIAEGDVEWKKVLNDFYGRFRQQLEKAESGEDGGMRANTPTETDIPCPSCGRNMQIRVASTGVFLGCSGYSLPPKERCKTTINLVSRNISTRYKQASSWSRFSGRWHKTSLPIIDTIVSRWTTHIGDVVSGVAIGICGILCQRHGLILTQFGHSVAIVVVLCLNPII